MGVVVVLVHRVSVPLLRGGRLLRPTTCWSGALFPAAGGSAAPSLPRCLGMVLDPSVSSPIAQGALCTFQGSFCIFCFLLDLPVKVF